MRCLIMGDTHFGEKGDSEKHNQQLIDMIRWVVDEFSGSVDMVIQVGDWFHNRSKTHTTTLEYAIQGAKLLSEGFGRDNVVFIVGNHDIPFKTRLDVTSLRSIEPYVTIYATTTKIDNMVFAPWIITEEQWDEVCDLGKNADYLFAHLELNGFLMNDHYRMEHGHSHKELKKYSRVFTGHYHSYQEKDNVVYTGTPIPMSMNEANRDMGVWVLDTDTGDYAMVMYDKVKMVSLSYEDIDDVKNYDPANTTIRIEFPDDLDDETKITDVSSILEDLNFSEVKIRYKGNKAKKLLDVEVDDIEEVENIDSVVKTFITDSTEIESIDKTILYDLYQQAIEMEPPQ